MDDAGAGDGGPVIDAGTPDASGAGFGEPCEEHADCQSGVCFHPDEGDAFCTETCDDMCPDGYACQTVVISEGVEADLCVPATPSFCNSCETSDECGDTSDLCVDLTGGRFCSIDCTNDPTICPEGFTCQIIAGEGDIIIGMQCKPLNGVCCIDGDGDLRGEGGGCVTTDCDDDNPDVYDDAPEICDGLDNDCVGGVDVDVTDCSTGFCQLGALGFFERGPEPCTDGECVMQGAVLCGLYTCADGGEDGDSCATACDGEDNLKCIPDAHCDDSVCLDDLVNGSVCDETSDCQSNHCQNEFCCDSGDCCTIASDCPAFGTFDPVCENPGTCQGSRGESTCINFICGTTGDVADDSACDATVLANECGFYLDLFCNGDTEQTPQTCPTSCSSDANCDANGFCNPASDTCVGDLDDGQACEEDAWCKSDHCQNGFCCSGGDCCASETDCPASYTTDPVCTTPSACQGERDVAQCVGFVCSTSVGVDDDSACDGGSGPANNCGPYLPVFCNGDSTQNPPECPESCTSDLECDANAYCNESGACVPDEPNGDSCNDADECQSAHCQNGFCCASGDCCADSGDCNLYDVPASCDDQTTCQGTRTDGTCTGAFQCTATVVNDDSACAGLQSNDCDLYPSVFCSSATEQPADQGGLCPTMCSGDGDCDASAHCDAGECVPDEGPGGACDEPSDCDGGLFCVDGVCCNSTCTGSCEACNVAGAEGTCAPIPTGTDPDGECPGFSCDGFYAGWSGDTCLQKADVSDAQASCNGARACRTQSQECTAQTSTVSSGITCDDTCQDPNLSTCTGTTAPLCTNVNPGTITCGLGQCQNTVPRCVGGADNTCTPGSPTPETCNDLDDNCNGTIDDGSFGDGFEPNNSCSAVKSLPNVNSDTGATQTGLTIFGSGDHDYFRIHSQETDSSCGCGGFSTDEDYELTVTLTVPPGAGSYMFCTGDASCGNADDNCQEVLAGFSGTWVWSLDGCCSPVGCNDEYDTFFHIFGDNSPGFECLGYTISYFFDAGLCN